MCNCVCVSVCVSFKTNSDVELKLLHIICLCMSSFSKWKKKKKSPITHPGSQVQTKKSYTFHIPQKGSKKQFTDIKRNSIQPFCTVQSQTWKKPLQSVHMARLFLAQQLEEKRFQKNHTECRRDNQVSRKSTYSRVR